MAKIDSRSFRSWFGGFTTGITVVTAQHKTGPIGITINSLTSVSLDPPLVLFCLDREAQVYSMLSKAKSFAVNILGEDQEEISRHFADFRHNPKPKAMWGKPQQGCPVLRHSLGWMVCQRTAIHKAGDHDIIVGKTVALHRNSANPKPLVYLHGRYRKIKD